MRIRVIGMCDGFCIYNIIHIPLEKSPRKYAVDFLDTFASLHPLNSFMSCRFCSSFSGISLAFQKRYSAYYALV